MGPFLSFGVCVGMYFHLSKFKSFTKGIPTGKSFKSLIPARTNHALITR